MGFYLNKVTFLFLLNDFSILNIVMSKQTPIIAAVTEWLGLRRNKMWLRYKEDLAPRSIPAPKLPPGVNAKLSNNYYYTRDLLREVGPPTVIYQGKATARLQAGEAEAKAEVSTERALPTPGFGCKWTISSDQPVIRT